MKEIEVVAAIIQHQNKILCCQRKDNKLQYLSEKWEFPGGKLEEGESKEVGLIREIKEELNMDISSPSFALTVQHTYPDFKLIMHCFYVVTNRQDFELHAHNDAKWLSKHDLINLDWAEADIPIVKFLTEVS